MKRIFFVLAAFFILAFPAFAGSNFPNNQVYLFISENNSTNTEYWKDISGGLAAMGYEGNSTFSLVFDGVGGLISWNATNGDVDATLEQKLTGSDDWLLVKSVAMNATTGAEAITTATRTRYRIHVKPGDWNSGFAEMWLERGPRLGRR